MTSTRSYTILFSSPITTSRFLNPISESTRTTFLPARASPHPILAEVVVFPTPPFPLVTTITSLMCYPPSKRTFPHLFCAKQLAYLYSSKNIHEWETISSANIYIYLQIFLLKISDIMFSRNVLNLFSQIVFHISAVGLIVKSHIFAYYISGNYRRR